MDEYKRPYLILFNGITDALEAIRRGDHAQAELILKSAQISAEKEFIEGAD